MLLVMMMKIYKYEHLCFAIYKSMCNKLIQKHISWLVRVCKVGIVSKKNSNVIVWCPPTRLPASPVDGSPRCPRRPSPWRDQERVTPSLDFRASRCQPVDHGQPFERQVGCKSRIWKPAKWWMWHIPGHRPGSGDFRKEDRGTVHCTLPTIIWG